MSGGPPWKVHYPDGATTGIDLLESIVSMENSMDEIPNPTLILLPEYAIRFVDMQRARASIAQLRPNSLVVFGIEQMTADQAFSLEDEPTLWAGPPEERFTNCALIGIGATDRIYLQPKILPSQWEPEKFWPGHKIRHFVGRGLSWIVQICSDLLVRPEEATTAADVTEWLHENSSLLSLVIWIQYNEKPRSSYFKSSVGAYNHHGATILAAGSAPTVPGRLENYGVSGALIQIDALPRHFHLLAKEFHYTEPVTDSTSRIVLLRYDADAYRASTVLADSINDAGMTSTTSSSGS
jgi:hypothetical protein